jgi:hypothetical protein
MIKSIHLSLQSESKNQIVNLTSEVVERFD